MASPFGERLFGVQSQAQRLQMDPWAHAYQMRFNPQYPQYAGKQEDTLRDVEHYLYARDTASRGPFDAAAMAMGIPGHAALKMLGVRQGDVSLEELGRGFQGIGAGLKDWWQGRQATDVLPGFGAPGATMRRLADENGGGVGPTIQDVGNRLWQWWMENGNGKRPGRPH